ncbi:MAG: tRNA pseudouridine(55) synthase TruB, partial [Scardovia wiggsiae]|nr:tRNA pseudouridine(55) synthase TruB [Scardovia wiggsiae]
FPDNVQRRLQHCLYSPAEAAALAMPVLAVSDADTEILRHGGMLPAHITSLTAAVNTGSHELIALVEPWKHHTAKPAAVFIA